MLERRDDIKCTISSTDVRDEGTTIHAVGNMDDYGKVRFSLTLVSSGDHWRRMLWLRPWRHEGRHILFGSFSGRWRREGTVVVARYVDLVSNGDMSLYIVRFDATEDEMVIEHHSFV